MARPPRIQFPGANYHIVTRGDGRCKLFHDQGLYGRFTNELQDEVQRSGWIVLAYHSPESLSRSETTRRDVSLTTAIPRPSAY